MTVLAIQPECVMSAIVSVLMLVVAVWSGMVRQRPRLMCRNSVAMLRLLLLSVVVSVNNAERAEEGRSQTAVSK